MRNPLLLAMVVLLACVGGCSNYVITVEPMFVPGATGAPMLRSGFWLLGDDPDPSNELASPPLRFRLEGDQLAMVMPERGEGETSNTSTEELPSFRYVVVPGEPVLIQLTNHEQFEGHPENRGVSGYFGFEPMERDGEGRVVQASVWIVECGPPPEPGDDNYGIFGEKGDRTNRPYAGLRMTGKTCEPIDLGDVASLRSAAVESGVLENRAIIRWQEP